MVTPLIFPNISASLHSKKRMHDPESIFPPAKEANNAPVAPVIESRRLRSVVQAAMPKPAAASSLSQRIVQALASKNDDSDGENGYLSEEGSDSDIRSIRKTFAKTSII